MALREGVRVFTPAEMPQGSEAWRTVRLGCLTGSRCSPVMVEKRPSATRDTLLLELAIERVTGRSPKADYQSEAMAQGIEREAAARREHEAQTGDLVTEVGFCYWVGHHVGFSPDGVVGDWDELISIKCRELRAHYEHLRRGSIPADAWRQMAHELWVAGPGVVAHNYVSYNPDFPEGLRYRRVRLTRTDLAVDFYGHQAEAFMQEVNAEVGVMKGISFKAAVAAIGAKP